jgi:radical SAM superfamily enzyme
VKPEFLELCTRLTVFPEFGLQTIHAEEGRIVQRQNNMARVEEAMEELARRGIAYMVTLIYGLPGQTLESFRATVDFCLARRVHVVRAYPLNLLRGTDLERDKARWGLVESGDQIPMVIRSNSFDEADWHQMRRIAGALAATEGRHPSSVTELLREQLRAA